MQKRVVMFVAILMTACAQQPPGSTFANGSAGEKVPATHAYRKADQSELPTSDLVFDVTPVTRSGRAYAITARPDIPPAPLDADNTVRREASGGQPPYTYRSSNPAVAVVDSSGLVTPRANGSASISVTDSAGATAAYTATFTGVVRIRYVGKMPHPQALSEVASEGERLPTTGELRELQQLFADHEKWPYPLGYYWTMDTCAMPLPSPTAVEIRAPGGPITLPLCDLPDSSRNVVGLK